MTLHPLAGAFSVEASARRIRHYRYAEERLMRTMAGWMALTPELPAKLVLGRHVWDCAQHADLWGKRLPELRAPAQRSEPANERVVRFIELLESVENPDQTPERLIGVYRVLKPHLIAVYERHLATANPVYEPPTRRILERCIADERRHVATGSAILARLPHIAARIDAWERRLVAALHDAGGIAGDGDVTRTEIEPDPHLARDLGAAAESRFDIATIEPALRDVIVALGRAAARGDRPAIERLVEAHARDALITAYGGASGDAEIVACAKIGAYRIVKMCVPGTSGASIVQLQCRPTAEGWRIGDARLIATRSAS